jgi:restriction endonuclease S subunit
LDKNQGGKLNDILFCEVKDDGTDLGAKRKTTSTSDLPIILESLQAFLQDSWTEDLEGQRISKAEILSNPEVTLSQNRYSASQTASSDYQVVKIGSLLKRAETSVVGSRLNIPVMSITMKSGLIDQGEKFKKRVASEDISNYKLVSRNQLVVGFPIDEGVLGFQKKYDFAAVSPAYEIWEFENSEDCNIEFFERILRSEEMRNTYSSLMQGSVSRRRSLPRGVFEELEIPLPPREVQEQIAAELDGYAAIIDGAKKIVENWKPRFDIDPEWPLLKLGDVASWSSGGTPTASDPKYYGGEIPWAVIGDLNEHQVKETEKTITQAGLDESSAKIVPANTVLLAMYGASIGKTGITGVPLATNQAIACAICKDDLIDPWFLLYFLQSQKSEFIRAGQGGAQPNISQTIVKDWPIPLPNLDTQKRVVEQIRGQKLLIHKIRSLILENEKSISETVSGLWKE